MTKRLLTPFFLLFFMSVQAQDMNEGFSYLESGKFEKASLFFEEILKTYPDNKTARLCYGRAIGLSGTPEKATEIFTALLSEEPTNYEFKLNYAESLLWNKKFLKAENYYRELIQEKEDSFPAILGYANTLSNLKKYKEALIYVNKALTLQSGNPNAMTSRKYIRLGYADELRKEKEYDKAIQQLEANVIDYPNDSELKLNIANIQIQKNEEENRKKREQVESQKKIEEERKASLLDKQIQQAVLSLELGEYNKSVVQFEKIRKEHPDNSSFMKPYAEALMYTDNIKQAMPILESLLHQTPEDIRLNTLYAQALYRKQLYSESVPYYKKVLSVKKELPMMTTYVDVLYHTKAYPEALAYINEILSVQKSEEVSILRRTVRNEYAEELTRKKNYDLALELLEENEKELPNDPEIMQKKARLYELKKDNKNAEKVYSILSVQNMKEGFKALETGKYEKARAIFKNILTRFPDNKTARLCYGRALGLSGDSEKAVLLFEKLLEEYPEDFEIKLNHAESLLWDKKYKKAASLYDGLTKEDATSFSAVLGYANTLSNLKEYEKALDYVNRALTIQKGNKNALISRKYVHLGYANKLAQDKEYDRALAMLDLNLVDFPNDKDTQLNRANIFLMTNDMDQAQKVYEALAISPVDSIQSMVGLSLVAHKNKKEKKALAIADTARTKAQIYKEKNKDVYLMTQERYVQALLWNRKFSKAKMEIDKLRFDYPEEPKILSLLAAYGMYASKYTLGLEFYKMLLAKDERSFDGNLGIANAYRAVGDDMKTYEYLYKTLTYYPKQPDAEKLLIKMKRSHMPYIEGKVAITKDNGENKAMNNSVRVEIPLSTKLSIGTRVRYRNTKNDITRNEASLNDGQVGLSYKFNGRITLLARGGITNADSYTNEYMESIGEIMLKTKPSAMQHLEIGAKRELQDFNAELINEKILMNHYFLNNNLSSTMGLGWYTQYMYTNQTDDNDRHLLFTSLYYNIKHTPVIKAGVNYQYISFKDQYPALYFSPKRFNVVEVFAEILNQQDQKWFYHFNVAGGRQFIEDDAGSNTYRLEGKLGYQVNRFKMHAYGKYSNIASSTAAGFEYSEVGVVLRWYFLKKPVFDKRIRALKTEVNAESPSE